tara:strand:+ start:36 stop:221 length:186 start_codon:yes stop_codon:yes gene_type:complete
MKHIVHVRFPNESFADPIDTFELKDFKLERKFSDEVFGYWKAMYVAVNRKDYERLVNEEKT